MRRSKHSNPSRKTEHLLLRGDTENAYLEAGGNVLVHADRDWLAFHASYPGNDPLRDARPIEQDDDQGAGSPS